jgi:hypothetical protein
VEINDISCVLTECYTHHNDTGKKRNLIGFILKKLRWKVPSLKKRGKKIQKTKKVSIELIIKN